MKSLVRKMRLLLCNETLQKEVFFKKKDNILSTHDGRTLLDRCNHNDDFNKYKRKEKTLCEHDIDQRVN